MSQQPRELLWETKICPLCGEEVPILLMSLSATCQCGAFYVDATNVSAYVDESGRCFIEHCGWYLNVRAYCGGEARIA